MSVDPLEKLDRMSTSEKVRHFARIDAYWLPQRSGEKQHRTMRMARSSLPKLNSSMVTLDSGSIIHTAKPVIGRPCFGIPTARLIHGRDHLVRGEGGKAYDTRCGGCPLKATCTFITEERIHHSSPRVHDAYKTFCERGGVDAVWTAKGRKKLGMALRDLVNALVAENFTNVNDVAVAEHYDREAEKRRAKDAERQRLHRASQIAATGKFDGDTLDTLKADCRVRVTRLKDAKAMDAAPHWLRKTNDLSFVGVVWLDKTMLEMSGRKSGATHIAADIRERFPMLATMAPNSLRKRVDKVLKRIPELEALTLADGQPCWPETPATLALNGVTGFCPQ